MLVTKKYVSEICLHVADIPIGHQHHNIPECDVDDRYVMFETWNSGTSINTDISCKWATAKESADLDVIWNKNFEPLIFQTIYIDF